MFVCACVHVSVLLHQQVAAAAAGAASMAGFYESPCDARRVVQMIFYYNWGCRRRRRGMPCFSFLYFSCTIVDIMQLLLLLSLLLLVSWLAG